MLRNFFKSSEKRRQIDEANRQSIREVLTKEWQENAQITAAVRMNNMKLSDNLRYMMKCGEVEMKIQKPKNYAGRSLTRFVTFYRLKSDPNPKN